MIWESDSSSWIDALKALLPDFVPSDCLSNLVLLLTWEAGFTVTELPFYVDSALSL